jgi:hypothetical protein
MTKCPRSAHILRGGLVLPDPATSTVMGTIVPQYASGGGAR